MKYEYKQKFEVYDSHDLATSMPYDPSCVARQYGDAREDG